MKIKNRFSYKGLNIKYKIEMYYTTIFDSKNYKLTVSYKYGSFFNSKSGYMTLDEAWTGRPNTVKRFVAKWENISKEDLITLTQNAIKEEIDEEICEDEMHEKINKIFH